MSEASSKWIVKADLDLRSAEHLNTVNEFSEIVCFHCQQAVEKYLKALLSHYGDVPRTRDLTLLTRMIERELGVSLDERVWECAEFLEPFSVQVRYPGDMDVSEQDAKQALKLARFTGIYIKTFLPK